MARVMLQPRGSAGTQGAQHFARTVVEGVPLAEVAPYVTAEDLAILHRLGSPLRLWGATPTVKPRDPKAVAVAERRVGDVVVFAAERRFVARARIAHLMENAELAEALWGRDHQDRTWQHIVVLTDVAHEPRPSDVLLEPLGIPPVVRRLVLLSETHSAAFLRAWDGDPLTEARDVLTELVGEPIETVTGRTNRIIRFVGDQVIVATDRAPDGTPVDIAAVQHGLDVLRSGRSVHVDVDELGYRSAFVGAVLKALPGTAVEGPPWRIVLTDDHAVDGPAAADQETDGRALLPYRLEQRRLRRALLGSSTHGRCDLCGQVFPAELLVAAHIKGRALCTPAERNDIPNVVMLACVFGCDALYERGYVSVTAEGVVVGTPLGSSQRGAVGVHVARLQGRRCSAHTPASAAYFGWHAATYLDTVQHGRGGRMAF